MEYSLTSAISFGRYKGKTVKEIADDNPRYLAWLFNNIPNFRLDPESKKYARAKIANLEARREAWAWGCLPSQRNADWGGLTDNCMQD